MADPVVPQTRMHCSICHTNHSNATLCGGSSAPRRPSCAGPEPWRVGQHYGIHVYEGDRPVATFHTVTDAQQAVDDHNDAARLRAVERAVQNLRNHFFEVGSQNLVDWLDACLAALAEAVLAEVTARRGDAAFAQRLRERTVEDKPILDRLADAAPVEPQGPTGDEGGKT